MKKHIFSLIFVIIPFIVVSQTTINGGNVSGIWSISESPFLITGNILIPNNSNLTIEPGVTIIFQGKYKLFCNGSITASGTEQNKITFTTTNPDGWLGIKFEDTPISNEPSI